MQQKISLSSEACSFWGAVREARANIAAGDAKMVRLDAHDLLLYAQHTEHRAIRARGEAAAAYFFAAADQLTREQRRARHSRKAGSIPV